MTRRQFEANITAFLIQHFTLLEIERIGAWAKKNIELTKEESKQYPGAFKPEISPSVSILWDFLEGFDYDEFICVKNSQLGMTLALLVAICHKICFNPQDMIIALNNREEIQRVGTTRLKPMIKACKAIAQRVPSDDDKMQNMTLYLLGCTLYLIGSHSPGAAANKSCGLVAVDETDESPESLSGNESNIIDLLRDRLKRQDGAKLVAFSKPRNADDVIWPEYLTGSRHKVFVPCPHCYGGSVPAQAEAEGDVSRLLTALPDPFPQGYQELIIDQMRYQHHRDPKTQRWDYQAILRDTWYECCHCKGRIDEQHKHWMLERRLYIPTNTPDGAIQHDGKTIRSDDWSMIGYLDDWEKEQWTHRQPIPRKLSYQTSDLYTLDYIPRSTWADLALELASASTESQRKKFRRSRLGLPEIRSVGDNSRTLADILAMQGTFERGHCSRVPLIALMGVDVQRPLKKWVKVVVYEDEAIEVVDVGFTLTYKELVKIAETPIIVDDWGDTPEEDRSNPIVESALIDEGDGKFTRAVLTFCVTRGAYRIFWPAKGRGGAQTVSMKDLVEKQKKNSFNGIPLPRYIFNEGAFKEELYDERIAMDRTIRAAKLDGRVAPAPQLSFHRLLDVEVAREFTSERRWTVEDEKERGKRKKKGARRGSTMRIGDWFVDGGPNDYADSTKMCLVQWYLLRRRFGIGFEGVLDDMDSEEEGEGPSDFDTEETSLEHE